MNTQQLIEAIKASTIRTVVHIKDQIGTHTEIKNVIDADVFLAAVERLAEAENLANIVGVAKDVVWPKK